jgi:hypothetical protein
MRLTGKRLEKYQEYKILREGRSITERELRQFKKELNVKEIGVIHRVKKRMKLRIQKKLVKTMK